MKVIKRNGDIKDFDENKIERVIVRASRTAKENVDIDTISKIVKYVVKQVAKLEEPIDVKDIRKAVENALMKHNLFDTARVYIDECRKREANYLKGLPIWEEMDIKLSGKRNDRQNANIDEETFGGRMGEAMDAMLKEKALNFMINPKFAKLMRECKNYIHDCNRWASAMHNCLSFPIDNIVAKASTIRVPNALRVPGNISTFCQIILVHLQSQSQDQFGGVSITHFDWSSVPFIRKTYWSAFKELLDVYNALMNKDIKMPCTKEECVDISITDEMYSNINSQLASFAYERTKKQTYQACEALLHNANTLQSRSGNQLPFTSVNYGTCTLPEGQLASEMLLQAWEDGIGEFKLTPIFPCGIFQLKDGINTKKGEPNYYLFRKALGVLPKRDYPNFANVDWSVDIEGFKKSQHIKQNVLEALDKETREKVAKLSKKIQNTLGFQIQENGKLVMNENPQPFEMMSTMGCRTYNGFDINFTEDYFLNKVLLPTIKTGELPLDQLWSGNQKDGRGNIIPNTVVMPMYAMEAKKRAEKEGHPEYAVDYFMSALDTAISNSKDELIARFNWIAAQPSSVSKYMYEWNHTMLGWDEKEGIRSCLKHGTLAIGQIGLSEVLYILIGKNQTTKEGMAIAERIEQLFNTKCAEYKEHYKLNFGVYFTPAEGLSYTSFKAFKKKYKDVENVTYWTDEDGNRHDKEYITNSIHVPVYQNINILDKFRTEACLAKYSNAGCITYGEIDGEVRWNIDALEQIILAGKRMDLPYIALNFQINECTQCGSTDIDTETKTCRRCKATEESINWLRRVTGYLTGNFLKAFNLGKQCETKQRVKHIMKTNDLV